MNSKHYLVISGIVGGVIGSLLTALLVSPVTAQRDKFGEIECRKLTVVNVEGMPMVELSEELSLGGINQGKVVVNSRENDASVELSACAYYGGEVKLSGQNGTAAVRLYADRYGGNLSLKDKNGDEGVSMSAAADDANVVVGREIVLFYNKQDDAPLRAAVKLSADEYGGSVVIRDVEGKSWTELGTDEHGGSVIVWGKDQISRATLGVGEHGGRVNAFDKDGKTRTGINITEHGSFVITRDKEGKSSAMLNVDEQSGGVIAYGKDRKSSVSIGAGDGLRFGAAGTDGKPKVTIGVSKQGDGIIGVAGNSEGAVILSIDDYGNGVVETYDKNGYRQK